MAWIVFSLLAALFWALTNTMDRYVLVKWLKNPYIPVIFFIILSLLVSLVIFLIHGIPILTPTQFLFVFLSGIFTILNLIFYLKAVQIGEISRIIPFFSLSPLFVAVLGAFFLGEVFSGGIYIAVFLLVVGAWILTSKNFHEISLGKAAFFMILSSLTFSSQIVIIKYLLNFSDNWTIFAYNRVSLIPFLIIFLILNWRDFIAIFNIPKNKFLISALISSRGLGIIAYLCLYIALMTGYATFVESLRALQPLFVLIIAVVLSLICPNIIQENMTKRGVIAKLIGTTLMIVGAIIVIV